jgi:hypothetical protein
MPRKRQTKKKATSNAQVNALVKSVKQLSVKRQKAKPFRDTGGVIGNRIGGMFGNASMGRGIGRWLGTGIGSIFGSGDYTLAGSSPAYNVIANGSQIPKFDTTRQTNVVCHREYLGDFTGTSAFSNNSFPLNPGIQKTFPWLSTVASSYQEYKFHGLIFEFRSLITDFVTSGAPGVVIMSTNYNADAPLYLSKQQMENAEFAVATKPTINLMHGVECADKQTILAQRYVRQGDVPQGQDLRLYDTGTFQFATAGNPTQLLGELWVSYCVEFFKPIQATVTGAPGIGFHMARSGTTNATPFGTASILEEGFLDVSVGSTTVTINSAVVGARYKVDWYWTGAAAVAYAPAAASLTNCVSVLAFATPPASPDSASRFTAPIAANSASVMETFVVTSNRLSTGSITITYNGAGVYPVGPVDIYVSMLDPAV